MRYRYEMMSLILRSYIWEKLPSHGILVNGFVEINFGTEQRSKYFTGISVQDFTEFDLQVKTNRENT